MSLETILSGLSRGEKLAAMDLLWRDLTREPAAFPSPAWHVDVLEQRLAHPADEPRMPLSDAAQEIRDRLRARRAEG